MAARVQPKPGIVARSCAGRESVLGCCKNVYRIVVLGRGRTHRVYGTACVTAQSRAAGRGTRRLVLRTGIAGGGDGVRSLVRAVPLDDERVEPGIESHRNSRLEPAAGDTSERAGQTVTVGYYRGRHRTRRHPHLPPLPFRLHVASNVLKARRLQNHGIEAQYGETRFLKLRQVLDVSIPTMRRRRLQSACQ